MNPSAFFILVLMVLAPGALNAQAPATESKLAVKRVALYKNGIGYFEHLGSVQDNQNVAVSFTSGQLDDVLKSLTVLDLDGGRISGVTYGSSAPLDRQMADLRLSTGEKATLTEFLGALRGARIEVKSGTTTMMGRLLSVERKTRTGGGTTVEVDYLSLLTDTGEMKTTELAAGFGLRLLDGGLTATVGKYLDLISSSREPDLRKMTIATAGSGQRRLFVSYISEVPVWKATYRIVLPTQPGQSPLLQGWAIVDNTGGQDWENVELSLIAGAPQSFIHKLSQPHYSRRPEVAMRESLNAIPQTFEAPLRLGGARLTGTVRDPSGAVIRGARAKVIDSTGAVVGETAADGAGRYVFESLPPGELRVEVSSPGFRRATQMALLSAGQALEQDFQMHVGPVTESVEVTGSAGTANASLGSAPNRNVGSGRMLGGGVGSGMGGGVGSGKGGGVGTGYAGSAFSVSEARARTEVAAQAQELGELFEYKLKEPITIRKAQSALVPILQSNVKAEKVSVWSENSRLSKPQRGILLENTSGLTLDGGSFSVLDTESFAGEGIFDSIQPGEKRLITYAMDLAVTTDSKASAETHRVMRAHVMHGIYTVVREQVENRTYTFRNEDSSGRTILVEHPWRPGYELKSAAKPVERSSNWMRFRLEVPAKQSASLTVEEARPIEATYHISKLSKDEVDHFVRTRTVNPELEEALRKVLTQKSVVAELTLEQESRNEESTKIYDDQQRLRENIKAMKGSAEERALLLRYTRQLNEQENRLEQLKKLNKELGQKLAAAEAELERMIQALSFDIPL